jgi:hypothetical protein
MRLLTIIIICFSTSCTPSFNRLLIYEETEQIGKIGLLVEFPEAFSKNDTMSSLYAKYGYEERAARIAEDKRKQEIWIKTAFLEKFNYCKLYYGFELSDGQLPHYSIHFFETEKIVSSGERQNFEKVLVMELYSTNPSKKIADSFQSVYYANSYGYTLQNYRNLVSQLQKRLEKYERDRDKTLQKDN